VKEVGVLGPDGRPDRPATAKELEPSCVDAVRDVAAALRGFNDETLGAVESLPVEIRP
jgi:hypothetical protein